MGGMGGWGPSHSRDRGRGLLEPIHQAVRAHARWSHLSLFELGEGDSWLPWSLRAETSTPEGAPCLGAESMKNQRWLVERPLSDRFDGDRRWRLGHHKKVPPLVTPWRD